MHFNIINIMCAYNTRMYIYILFYFPKAIFLFILVPTDIFKIVNNNGMAEKLKLKLKTIKKINVL